MFVTGVATNVGIFDERVQQHLQEARAAQLKDARDEVRRLRLLLLQSRFASAILDPNAGAEAKTSTSSGHQPKSGTALDKAFDGDELAKVRGELSAATVALAGVCGRVGHLLPRHATCIFVKASAHILVWLFA